MTDHDRIIGICLSHHLCPRCSRGYMSRKRCLKVRCPNPGCYRDDGMFVETFTRGFTHGTIRLTRYTRLRFRLGSITLGRPPAEGALYAWINAD